MEEEKPSESTTKGITITTAEQFTEQTSISTTDGSNTNPMSANLTKKATQFLLTLVTSTPATTMEVGPPDWVRSVEESFRQKFLDKNFVSRMPCLLFYFRNHLSEESEAQSTDNVFIIAKTIIFYSIFIRF